MQKFRKKVELINKLERVTLNDISFWEEVVENFSPQEVKEMRRIVSEKKGITYGQPVKDFNRFKGSFKKNDGMFSRRMLIDAGSIQEKDRAMFDFLLNKHEEGLIGWTEGDQEEFEAHLMLQSFSDALERELRGVDKYPIKEYQGNFKPISLFEEPEDESGYNGFTQID